MTTPLPQNLQSRRHFWIDLLIRAALAMTFAVSAGACFHKAFIQLHGMDWDHPDAHMVGEGFSVLAIGLYSMMIACLYAVRIRPISAFAGVWPCAAAILGGFLLSGLLFFNPRHDLSLTVQVLACALVIIGNVFTVLILLRLGKSFSILPESRKLVTTGPYKIIRHPLYLAEAVTTLGALINFLSMWALLLVAVQIALQITRMHYEEKVLRQTFPEYTDYAQKTARLIPGIY